MIRNWDVKFLGTSMKARVYLGCKQCTASKSVNKTADVPAGILAEYSCLVYTKTVDSVKRAR